MDWIGSVSTSMPLLLLLVVASAFSVPVSLAEESCIVKLSLDLCAENDVECTQKLQCRHGQCDPTSGCVCEPCWSGASCDEYVDNYGPTFATREIYHQIRNTPEGLTYQLKVNDNDLGFTCLLGEPGPPARCPCAMVEFHVVSSDLASDAVELDPKTGVMDVADWRRIDCKRRYHLQIEARALPPDDAGVAPRRDTTNLTLWCEPDMDAELLRAMEEADDIELGADDALYPPQNGLEELTRAKRDSAGANPEHTAMDLVRTSASGVSAPKIGALLSWEFTINLPTTSGMDMTVEAFVADLDSGESVFHITQMAVISVGSGVSSSAAVGSANAITKTAGEVYYNEINMECVDRAVLNLGTLVNTDPTSDGTADASKIKIALSAVVIRNPSVSAGTQQYASIGAEYDGANYVQISQEAFTPDSTATDISAAVGTPTAAVSELIITQFTAEVAQISVPVVAAMGALQVEAHIAGSADEDALSIGGVWVELGEDFLEPRKFNADDYRTNQIKSKSGGATRLKSVEFGFRQTGDSAAATSDTGRTVTIKIPVFATSKSVVGGTALLVVFVRAKDTVAGDFIATGAVTKFAIAVQSGAEPATSGSLTLQDASKLISTSADVPAKSIVEYNVEATATTSGVYIASDTLTLDTSGVEGFRACDVEVISQGVNVVYMEASNVVLSPSETGENTAVITVQKIRTQEVTSDDAGYVIKFRLAMRADVSGGASYTMGSSTFNLPDVNISGTGSGAQPTVTVNSPAAAATTIFIGSQFGVDLNIEYPVNDIASSTDADYQLEFASDLRQPYEVRLCSVHVVSVGRDLPCARGKLAGGLSVTYTKSNSSREYDDVASTSVPLTCASGRVTQDAADRTLKVRAVGQVIAGQTLGETSFNPGAGIIFDESTLYAGLVSDLTLGAELITYTGSGDPTLTVLSPGTLTFGKVHIVDVMLYVPPGANSPMLSVTATSANPAAFRVDRIFVRRFGRNYGCMDGDANLVNLDQLAVGATPDSYPAFSVDSDQVLGSSATLQLGAVSNVGSGTAANILNTVETTDVLVQDDHIFLAVAVQGVIGEDGATPADATFELTVAGQKDSSGTIASVTGNLPFSGAATQYSAGTDPAPSMVLAPRDNPTVYKSIPKVVDVSVTLPEDYYGTLKVQCVHPSTDATQWQVNAKAVGNGQNVHGVWVAEASATLTKSDLGGIEMATQADLVLRDITRLETKNSPVAADNELKVACVVLVPEDSGASGSISLEAVLLDSADAQIASGSASLTVSTDAYTGASTPISANQTIDLSANTEPPSASIGQFFWVPFKLIVPPGVHEAELAVVAASDAERALFTVHGIRYGENIGADVQGVPILTEELLNFTRTNMNMTHQSQYDTVLVKLGYITNLGLSEEVFRGKGSEEEWGVEMEVQLRVTDHPMLHAASTATQPLYISLKLSDIIVVEQQDISATVSGSEKVILETELTLSQPEKTRYDQEADKKVGLSVTMRHSNMSTQAAMDARAVIIFPRYMNYTAGEIESNSSSITVLYKGSSVALMVEDMYLTDIYTINFNASIDPDFVRGRGSGWANATTLARPICRPHLATNAFSRCGPMTYTMYEVNNPECSEPLLASLPDCRFAASAVIETSGSYGPEAVKGAGWRPPARDDPAWISQYVEFRFGVRTRISGWQVTNAGRKVTEVKLMASDNGIFFQEKYTGTVTDGMAKEELGDNSFHAQYVRILISAADADVSNYIQISAELYGCHTDSQPEATCEEVEDNTIDTTKPRKWRHFAVDTTNDIIYYCDYDMAKDAMLCFASHDGSVWIGQPKYIGELRGHSAGKMYAYDSKRSSTLASTDGQHWQVAADADVPASLDPVMTVKGTTAPDSVSVTQGGYEGDYFGIKKTGGDYLVKWSKCCGN